MEKLPSGLRCIRLIHGTARRECSSSVDEDTFIPVASTALKHTLRAQPRHSVFFTRKRHVILPVRLYFIVTDIRTVLLLLICYILLRSITKLIRFISDIVFRYFQHGSLDRKGKEEVS